MVSLVGVVTTVTSAITGAVVSVVVVSSVVPVAEYSSLSSLHEMMVRLRNEIRIMYKTLFIFSSIPKVNYYGLVLGEPYIYHNLGEFTRIGDFTWRVVSLDWITGGILARSLGGLGKKIN